MLVRREYQEVGPKVLRVAASVFFFHRLLGQLLLRRAIPVNINPKGPGGGVFRLLGGW